MTVDNEIVRSKLEEIYLNYRKDMFLSAYYILKDYQESEDMVKEAILRVYKNLHKILDIKCKKTRAYQVIIVRNLSLTAYNKRKNIIMLECR